MNGFSADWLQRREPADRAARDAARPDLVEWLLAQWGPRRGALRVVDLACGTGANLRYLAPRLGDEQVWEVVDHDGTLLAAWPGTLAAWAGEQGWDFSAAGDRLTVSAPGFSARIERRRLDLAVGLDALDLGGAPLVTGSALLDLVSAEWLRALVRRCSTAGSAMLFALSVDGRIDWPGADVDPDDAEVLRLFGAHQRRDKGFGPALGGEAPARFVAELGAAGYWVRSAVSDWWLEAALQREVLEGVAGAITEQDPHAAEWVARWLRRHVSRVGETAMRVGHCEVAGWA